MFTQGELLLFLNFKYSYQRYNQVVFDLSKFNYNDDIPTEEILNNVLASLYVKGYIEPNKYTKVNKMLNDSIILTEKAIELFYKY